MNGKPESFTMEINMIIKFYPVLHVLKGLTSGPLLHWWKGKRAGIGEMFKMSSQSSVVGGL